MLQVAAVTWKQGYYIFVFLSIYLHLEKQKRPKTACGSFSLSAVSPNDKQGS